jgi:hypothetical protein
MPYPREEYQSSGNGPGRPPDWPTDLLEDSYAIVENEDVWRFLEMLAGQPTLEPWREHPLCGKDIYWDDGDIENGPHLAVVPNACQLPWLHTGHCREIRSLHRLPGRRLGLLNE